MQRSRWFRVLGFVIVPMMSIASPLLAIPAITSQFGAAGWSAVAIGQSMGASFAVISELGWGLTGPQRVARQAQVTRRQTLAIAFITKMIVVLPLATAAGTLSFFLAQDFRLEAAGVAVGTVAYAMNSNWYFIGTGSSAKLLATDAVPRLICVAACAIFIFAGGPLALYPAMAIVLPTAIGVFMVINVEGLKHRHLYGMTSRRLLLVFQSQAAALGGRSLSAAYMALPVTLVSLVSPQAVAIFSAVERLQRIYLQVLAAVPNMMQTWVGQSIGSEEKYNRSIRSIYLNASIGAFAALLFTAIAPLAAQVVFASTIDISIELAAISGILIFLTCTSRASGSLALVAFGRTKSVLASAAAGASIGIPSILIGAYLYGSAGALAGEVIAELSVLTFQLIAIRRYRT